MAGKTDFDSSPHNSQISRDMQLADSSIPLSPQWLLSKPGENKMGTVTADVPVSPFRAFGNRLEFMKSPGNDDQSHDSQKKKDVFRPSVLDSRERWRDEERDTNSFVRKDARWREGDKELQVENNRKVDRWAADSASGRNYGESRRAPWAESGNKDPNHDQRRESKWNTRWGPDDKETDHDIPHDKGLLHPIHHIKDNDREGDQNRPWRSNSALNRGRGDHQSPGSNKQSPMFVHGRGRGENLNPTFSLGRGRGGTHLHSLGSFSDDMSPMRYSRTKMLDVYRIIDMKASGRMLDGAVPVPSLTQEEPLEPLALISPTPEELFILKGIDKGDILSSGAPQISKDGSTGHNLVDVPSRRTRLGSKEDLPHAYDNYKDETGDSFKGNYSDCFDGMSHEKQVHSYETNFKADAVEDRQSFMDYKSKSEALGDGGSWRSLSIGQRAQPNSHDLRDMSTDIRSRPSEPVWSQSRKDNITNEWSSSLTNPSYVKDGPKWKVNEDPVTKSQQETRMLSQPSNPEDLVLFYKDPQGAIQGPFTGSDIIGWFEAAYFGIDLQVRLANAPHDSPFASLGDVMPHLRAKARPPPGFTAAKQSEINEESSMPNFIGTGKVQAGLGENPMMKNDPRFQHGSTTEAENRFIESLMSTNMSGGGPLEKFGLSEGMQGYFGNPSSIPGMGTGTESGENLYQLAKLMQLERQKSLSNPYSLWSGRDAAIGPKSDILQDPTIQPSNILSNAPNPEFMSILQGLSDRSTSAVSSGVSNWSNFPPQTAFGVQQQRNLPSLANLRPQGFDNLSGPLNLEKLLSSGLPQDQILSLLQQQHMSQMKPQASIQTPQLSVLDEYLLLKQQQQKQEQLQQQQQQIMRQQLLSQVLVEQHSLQRLGEQSCGPMLTPGLSVGNSSVDHIGFPPSHEMLQMGLQNQVPNVDIAATNIAHMSSMGDNHRAGPEDPIHLPHQLIANTMQQKGAGDEIGHQKEPDMRTYENLTTVTADPALNSEPADHFEQPLVPSVETIESEILEVPMVQSKPSNEPAALKETKAVEVKKGSEKKSKKQKSSKAQSSDMAKAASKTPQPKQSETEAIKVNEVEVGTFSVELKESKSSVVVEEPARISGDVSQILAKQNEVVQNEDNVQVHTAQRAWKPAPGFKPKSLLEIQQEEQRRAQAQAQAQAEMLVPDISTSLGSMNISNPWAGVVGNSDQKPMENKKDWAGSDLRLAEGSQNQKSKSQLHDLLAGEVAVKLSEKTSATSDNITRLRTAVTTSQSDLIEEDNFIEAKESKKSRKKSAKAKAAVAKASVPAAVETPVSSSPNEKGKNSRQEKDVLPAVPSGPSLGDFVVWKGEAVPPPPAPAWSTDSGKIARHTSLRDILKEQEKKVSSSQHQMAVPTQKSVSAQSNRGNGPSWSSSASSPAKVAASPIQIMSHGSSQSRNKVDDDLFWGPIDHPKQEAKRSDFPQLANQGGWAKNTTPGKGVSGSVSMNRQKSGGGGRPAETPLSSSPALKGKRDVLATHSEAKDFRDWCKSECVRLLGSKDTSILEFCMKQSRSEAELLLKENLGLYDPEHEFIDKFLNYKDFLPSDVLEMAFQEDGGVWETEKTDVSKGGGGGGKKKGKKGKKVSPAVLGFNVVSNRIMMGEIETVED